MIPAFLGEGLQQVLFGCLYSDYSQRLSAQDCTYLLATSEAGVCWCVCVVWVCGCCVGVWGVGVCCVGVCMHCVCMVIHVHVQVYLHVQVCIYYNGTREKMWDKLLYSGSSPMNN